TGTDTIMVSVWTHASAASAQHFVQAFRTSGPSAAVMALAGVPGGVEVTAKSPAPDGSYYDTAVAANGARSLDIEVKTSTPGPVPFLVAMAQEEFRRFLVAAGT